MGVLQGEASLIPPDDARFYRALGGAVKVYRAHRGLGRRELAAASGLSYSYLSEIENGRKRLSARALLFVSRGLDVRPYEILSMAEAWSAGHEPGADAGGETARSPAIAETHRMLSQLSPSDAVLASDLIHRLYLSRPERVPASVTRELPSAPTTDAGQGPDEGDR